MIRKAFMFPASLFNCCAYRYRSISFIRSKSMSATDRYYMFLESEKFQEVLSFSERELEGCHDFIQWAFPTTTPSQFNYDAPVIKVDELRKNVKFPMAQEKIKLCLKVMKNHWGLNEDGSVNNDKIRRLNGHNGLRFSRVIQSLVYHDLVNDAKDMLAQVLKVSEEYVRPRREGPLTIWETRLEQAVKECE